MVFDYLKELFGSYGVFEEVYTSPNVVLAAFFFLIAIMVFSMLSKTRLGEDKGVNIVITVSISGMFVYMFRDLIYWLATFNILLIITAVAIFVVIFVIPLSKYLRANLG